MAREQLRIGEQRHPLIGEQATNRALADRIAQLEDSAAITARDPRGPPATIRMQLALAGASPRSRAMQLVDTAEVVDDGPGAMVADQDAQRAAGSRFVVVLPGPAPGVLG